MDDQISVSSDHFELTPAQWNSNHTEESESMYQIPEKKKSKGRGKKKEQQPNMKKAINKKVCVKSTKKQPSSKNIASKSDHTVQKKQNNLNNNFAMQFAEVFDDDLLHYPKAENERNQNIIQEDFDNKVQVENQFQQIESQNNQFNFIQQPEEEQIQANEVQQNVFPIYIDNKGKYQYLRSALSRKNEHQPLLFKRFLNSLEMTQEEYDNIKLSFPQIPSEYLPQVILEQRQINKAFLNKQPQQQQQYQQIIQNQQQQVQGNQFFQNEKQLQENQLNFIETDFKLNPNLSDDNLECAICSQTYLDGDKLAILPCIHRFHLTCFTCWLKKSKQCPICHHG